jgi:hypothetical protein
MAWVMEKSNLAIRWPLLALTVRGALMQVNSEARFGIAVRFPLAVSALKGGSPRSWHLGEVIRDTRTVAFRQIWP